MLPGTPCTGPMSVFGACIILSSATSQKRSRLDYANHSLHWTATYWTNHQHCNCDMLVSALSATTYQNNNKDMFASRLPLEFEWCRFGITSTAQTCASSSIRFLRAWQRLMSCQCQAAKNISVFETLWKVACILKCWKCLVASKYQARWWSWIFVNIFIWTRPISVTCLFYPFSDFSFFCICLLSLM